MLKKAFSLVLISLFQLLLPKTILAVCPVCTVAVGAGLGLSRYLGIDDLISGFWVGGLTLSISFWLINWLQKKPIKIPYLKVIAIILMYALVLAPLFLTGIIGSPFNRIWGIDKVVLGTLVGSMVFLGAVNLDKKLRQIYGRQFFYYQKVVFPFTGLIIVSLLVYLLLNR